MSVFILSWPEIILLTKRRPVSLQSASDKRVIFQQFRFSQCGLINRYSFDTMVCSSNLFPSPLHVTPHAGNKQKWVPLMIEVKSEGPRERSASRNNSRQNENPRLPPNARNDLRGQ